MKWLDGACYELLDEGYSWLRLEAARSTKSQLLVLLNEILTETIDPRTPTNQHENAVSVIWCYLVHRIPPCI